MPAPDQRVPELVGGIDVRTLPLSAIDGFVLSRIDGRSSSAEIVAMTGLGSDQVLAILDRLVELGAVRFRGESVPPARSTSPRTFPPPREGGTLPPQRPTPSPKTVSMPPRRRNSQSMPRRMMSESSISGPPPPDVRAFGQRARNSTPNRPKTPVPPQAAVPPSREPPPTSEPVRRSSSQVFGSVPPFESRLPPESVHVPLREPFTMPVYDADHARTRDLIELTGARGYGVEPTVTPAPQSLVDPHAHTLPFDSQNDLRDQQTAMPSAAQTGPLTAPRPPDAPLYDPAELDEVVELPLDRKKQVLELYHRLSLLNYYEVLGVAVGADKKDVRSAYFALSKVFHPDSMFRKELGSFKAKMTAVFQALTEAYETLSKKKSREEYDAYLRSLRSAEDAERALATEEVAQADANVEVPRPPPIPTAAYDLPVPTPVPRDPARDASPEARRVAREVLERRLRGIAPPRAQHTEPPSSKMPLVPPVLNEPPTNMPPDRKDLARRLTRTLIDVSKVTGSSNKLTRAISAARGAFERGDIAEAVQHMARAVAMEPSRTDLQSEYERLSRMLAESLADDYVERAKFEVKQGKWASAALSWAKVCEGRPEDSPAHRAAAFALLKAGGDLRGAQKYAQRAAFLAPDDIDARILLAQIYLTVGLKLNAKRELDTAAKLDPANEMVKNLLSELKV